MEYLVDLEAFHGPLDLLLYLVEKNQVDIYDIPIAVISEQYLEYLQASGGFDLERLGDFLLMASYLLSIKSKLLLPAGVLEAEEDEELPDPRQELIEKLLAYKQFKEVAGWLENRQSGSVERIYYRDEQPGSQSREELVADLRSLVKAYKAALEAITETVDDYEIPQGDVNVSEKMEEILERLQKVPQGIVFQKLFIGVVSRREALALFLALLELIRLQQVEAAQGNPFADIEIRLIDADYTDL
ncbi:segregation and condensation protein A [Syntrophomonas curvata]